VARMGTKLNTPFCTRFGIDVPILVAPFGPWDEVELAVAAASAGCLASLGTAVRSVPELEHQWATLRDRTDRPFVLNHTGRPFNPEAFAATLAFKPGAIYVLIAQGTEAGGNGGWIGTLVLVPLIVDLAGDVPVVAAGGIADGRGIAAVLTLGAQAASLGTRFLATDEMAIDPSWKSRIREASATDAVKVPHAERVMPPFTLPQIGMPFAPRALRTPLIDQLASEPDSVDPAAVGPELLAAVRAGGGHDLLPFAGQSAALVRDVVPAAQLVERLVVETTQALERAHAAIFTD
jgi:enoyl-[acyl-carrier protein] reductase II